MTYDSQSVINPTPAPAENRGEGQSIVERDEIEEIIAGVSAMDVSATWLRRGGECITQEGAAAAEEVRRVNPDPSTEAPFTRNLVFLV